MLFLAGTLDIIDGQMAREMNMSSKAGAWLRVTSQAGDLIEVYRLRSRKALITTSSELSDMPIAAPQGGYSLVVAPSDGNLRTVAELIDRLEVPDGGLPPSVLFVGSEAAIKGGRNGAVYSATKFALRGLAQALQEECSASGVRVGIINPGMVNTGFFDELDFRPGDEADQHLVPDDVVEAVLLMLDARQGAVIREINLQPQKRVIRFD